MFVGVCLDFWHVITETSYCCYLMPTTRRSHSFSLHIKAEHAPLKTREGVCHPLAFCHHWGREAVWLLNDSSRAPGEGKHAVKRKRGFWLIIRREAPSLSSPATIKAHNPAHTLVYPLVQTKSRIQHGRHMAAHRGWLTRRRSDLHPTPPARKKKK